MGMHWFGKRDLVLPDIGESSLALALAHLRNEGDGDIFPPPFELQAPILEAAVSGILKTPLSQMQVSEPRSFDVVRFPLKSRRTTQFYPIDSLLLEALVYRNLRLLEAARRPISERSVFSYRLTDSTRGVMYYAGGWQQFALQGFRLASESEYAVILDLRSFYDSIPHAYIAGRLTAAGLPQDHLAFLMSALSSASSHGSKGIPIGPHFSHILAELTLCELDNLLTSQRIPFCRFADDIHAFANSPEQIASFMGSVEAHLKSIGLEINRSKFFIFESERYGNHFVRRRQTKEISSLQTPFPPPEYGLVLSPEALIEGRNKYKRLNVSAALLPYLATDNETYSGLAFALRLMRRRGVPRGLGFISDNLEKLLPVITEAMEYMETVAYAPSQVTKAQLTKLVDFYGHSIVKGSPYLQVLLIRILGKISTGPAFEKVFADLEYLTADGRREVFCIANDKKCLTEWIKLQGRKVGLMSSWERSAFEAAVAAIASRDGSS
jgi:hypothetical protein